jgi:transposase-like protein
MGGVHVSASRISSSEAARLIGIKTNTLARWRVQGKGPAGAIRLSATHTVYPLEAVEAFLREKVDASRFLGTPPGTSTSSSSTSAVA